MNGRIRNRLVFLLLFSLTGLFGNFAEAEQQTRPTVQRIIFEGANGVSHNVLQNVLITRSGMPLDSSLVVKDMKRILEVYQTLGYWNASVHFPEILVKAEKATVRFGIEEQVRTQVDSIVISGQTAFAKDDLRTPDDLSRGVVLTPERLEAHLGALLDFYENRGYPFCALTPEVKFQGHGAQVYVDIDAGPLCYVDTILFVGNAVTRDAVLLREMRLELGQLYDQRRVDRAVRYLRRVPFLISVDDPEVYREGDRTILSVRVREARTARIEGGLGYAPQSAGGGLTGRFALHVHNVAGAGRLGQVVWQRTGVGASDLRVKLEEPWVFARPLSAYFELGMQTRVGYSEWRVGVGSALRVWEQGTIGVQASRRQVVPDSSGLGIYKKNNQWGLLLDGRLDYRDNIWNPRRGWIGQVAFEVGRVEGFGKATLRREQSIQGQFFYDLSKTSVWALGMQGAWISQAGGVPQDARIRVGGARTLRGYHEEAFWVTRAVWTSFEWRFLVGSRSRIFGFVDAGILNDLQGRVWPLGYGAGLVLYSKMGLIGVDVGWAKEDGLGDGKIHVKLENAF